MNTQQIAQLKRELERVLREDGFSRSDSLAATAIASRIFLEDHSMNSSQDILDAVNASNTAFEAFKHDMELRLEKAEAKAYGRPGNGGLDIHNLPKSVVINPNAPEVKAFERYLRTGQMPPEQKDLTESTGGGADGGYAVPKVIDQAIEAVLLKQSPLRKYAHVVQISTPQYHKLVNKRGFVSAWVGELAARTATGTAQLVDIAPPMGELYSNPQASQQMVDDVFFNVFQWLTEELGIAFAESESNCFINGTGTNQPLGFLSGPTPVATVDASRAFGTLQYVPTGAAANFVAVSATASPFDILQQVIFSMRPGYRQGAVWAMHPTTLGVMAQVKDTIGRPIMVPSLIAGQPPTIMGYEVCECEHMPLIGAGTFPIAFGNFKRGYIIVDRMGTRVIVDPFTNKPYVGYYTTKRTGGTILNSECIKLVKVAVS